MFSCDRHRHRVRRALEQRGLRDHGPTSSFPPRGSGGAGANTRRISVPGGQFGSVESSATQLLTGLSGGTINVGAFVSFADTYTVQSVSVSGSILFLV